jgi:hypothetical protein
MPFDKPMEIPKMKMLIFEPRTATFGIRFRDCGQKIISFVETTTGFMTTFTTFASSYDVLLVLKTRPAVLASSSATLLMLLAKTMTFKSSSKIWM